MTAQPFVCYGKIIYIFEKQNELFESNPMLIKNKKHKLIIKIFHTINVEIAVESN